MPSPDASFSFDAVLFDLDGVLIDSEGLSGQVLLSLLGEHALPFTHEEFSRRAVGASFPVLFEGLERDFGWVRPNGIDARIDAGLAAALTSVPAIEGAADTLRALARRGVPFAVASNSRRDRLDLKLRASGLDVLLDGRSFDSSMVGGRGKPNPDLYAFAAASLGVDVTRCLVIEDSVPGATAGVSAGATVWGLLAGGHVHPNSALELERAGVQRTLRSHEELRTSLNLE
ncbi:HAD family hydrolase [Deinococcus yavapaiensis]|uniref:HAD superfamily hydrolase (TIGR01509 family) n=1 Tax=Deinococcus yavapaiensis KR-236 TaxID=694435 RepID=A0A318SKQ3_9DEIO|nr:HAD-IA family hydrolase [Deinococcus yavapaiensis]PYE54949.1 HAD superfamily hydrolase (TIGR01509 family) [Deinococcus yavapaiensis KR-236]